jgi:hypothetical protein
MSVLPPKADIRQRIEHVCFVPIADIDALASNSTSAALHRAGLCGSRDGAVLPPFGSNGRPIGACPTD